jgi:hypothetical protein
VTEEKNEKSELDELVDASVKQEGWPEGMTQEQINGHKRWAAAAYCLGYNELAKQAQNLGEKVFFRLARDSAVKSFIELGGNAPFTEEPTVLELELPDQMPRIKFRAQDIELMRAAVQAEDEEKGTAKADLVLRAREMSKALQSLSEGDQRPWPAAWYNLDAALKAFDADG